MARSAVAEAPKTDTKPVVTDATDPETVKANNVGGPSVPADMPEDLAKLFDGTNIDWNAPITKASLKKVTSGKGRQAKPLEARVVTNLENCLKMITGPEGEEKGATFGLVIFPKHEEFVGIQNRIRAWVKDNNTTDIALKVGFSKHIQSPLGYEPSKTTENKGKSMIYVVNLEREVNESAETASE